ncbi:membrane acyltransferase [Mycobacterium tuberculosis T17]|nr:membrane acyltransferase [Mycobacterium tuberculosis T17]
MGPADESGAPIRPQTPHRHTVLVTNGQVVGGTRGFLPAVEGMRACAAVGVVVTHVAFQTGHSSGVGGRLFGRFDLAVAVFFAVSGFLLWRGHAAAARDLRSHPRTGPYLRSRVARIMPAYVVAVVVILSLLPDADHASLTVWLANLTLTQIYVPLTLTGGLTQMWSLSVEVSFYAALPVLALLGRRIPVGARVPAIAALAALSWAWGWLPLDAGSGINPLTWPPAFFSWFAAGMSVGAPPRGDGGYRAAGLPGGGLAVGGSGGPGSGHGGPIRGENRDGLAGSVRAGGAAGAGPARPVAPAAGQPRDGDPGPLVLWLFIWHLAPAGPGVSP